ncbi:MAG: diaminopimelate epimerase [Deltaproteobacteria bacterium]|nr:diaminopimelate epimerase [Deltaproteobacteria bacterium]
MSNLPFIKMHGCGNDFLIFDAFKNPAPHLNQEQVAALCDRHFGIGADGLVVLGPGTETHAEWSFFNSDGSVAAMCGNAARCAFRLLFDEHFKSADLLTLVTGAGVVNGRKRGKDLIEVTMLSTPVTQVDYCEKVMEFDGEVFRLRCLNTGVPHAVIEVTDLQSFPVSKVGRFFVRHPVFLPEGTNVTFYQKGTDREILSTTFERGVENETYACGTGVVAAAILFVQDYLQHFPVEVQVPGGKLIVDLTDAKRLLLTGPAEYVADINLTKIPALDAGERVLHEN